MMVRFFFIIFVLWTGLINNNSLAVAADLDIYTAPFPAYDASQQFAYRATELPFYGNAERTNFLGTYLFYCIHTSTSLDVNVVVQCDFYFDFHQEQGEDMSFGLDMLQLEGLLFPTAQASSGAMAVITGGAGTYFGVGGRALLQQQEDGSDGMHFELNFTKQPTTPPNDLSMTLWYDFGTGQDFSSNWPLVNAMRFYGTDPFANGEAEPLGTMLIYCTALPSEKFFISYHCQYVFAFHTTDQKLADAVDTISLAGIMIMAPVNLCSILFGGFGPFPQVFSVTGGTGIYHGVRGEATVGNGLDTKIKVETPQPPSLPMPLTTIPADVTFYTAPLISLDPAERAVTADTGPMYADQNLTQVVGTYSYYCVSFVPKDDADSQVLALCDVLLGFHASNEQLMDSNTDTVYADGIVLRDKATGRGLLQLLALGGGTGAYTEARGTMLVDDDNDSDSAASRFQLYFAENP